MCGRGNHSTNLRNPSGPFGDRFVYRHMDEAKKVLAEHERAIGEPAFMHEL